MISPLLSRTTGITLSSVCARLASSLKVMRQTEIFTQRGYMRPARLYGRGRRSNIITVLGPARAKTPVPPQLYCCWFVPGFGDCTGTFELGATNGTFGI